MQFIAIDSRWRESFAPSALGIPEPLEGTGAVFDTRDAARTVVIVPGLAFDRVGNRLGRGGGYYDRFLGRAALHPATTVGVCWSLQMIESVPTESHDVGIDWVCYERGYVDCRTTGEARG